MPYKLHLLICGSAEFRSVCRTKNCPINNVISRALLVEQINKLNCPSPLLIEQKAH